MPLITENSLTEVRRTIRELTEYWKTNNASILTEFDLQALLFSRLINNPTFSGEHRTADNHITCTMVHGELSWYGPTDALEITPDITILEPSGLSITRNIFNEGLSIPNKQCAFMGQAILIEVKINKHNRYYLQNGGIEKDIRNLKFLIEKFQNAGAENKIHTFHVVLDRCINSNLEHIQAANRAVSNYTNYELFYSNLTNDQLF